MLKHIEGRINQIIKYCPPPARVLDLGCYDGEIALELAMRGYSVVAVDDYTEVLVLEIVQKEKM